ncbi:MAG: glycosyltransferase family 39 protein [Rhodobacteraceae bacterium]|nr:glycosyltransferase family 39 protein [Paracoccaceae bacterium]
MTRILPAAVAGLAILGAASGALGYFAGSGDREKLVWLAASCALAVVIWAVAGLRGSGRFGVLAAAFAAGAAGQLWLTEPLWFPALAVSKGVLAHPGTAIALLALLIEAAVTALVLAERLRGDPARLAGLRRLGLPALVVLVAAAAAFSAAPTPYIAFGHAPSYILQAAAGGALTILHLGCIAAMLSVTPPAWSWRPPVAGLAVFATVASAFLAHFAFQYIPHVEDEVAYLFQAKTFAAGHLTMPAPPGPVSAYYFYLVTIDAGRWMAVTAPGWPTLLALGVLLGQPWLVNPVLAGLSVWLAYAVFSRTISRDRGLLVAALMATSPWFLAVSGSMMTHAIALFLTLLAWRLLVVAPDATRTGPMGLRYLAAGLAMGWLFTTRPLEGVIVGGLTGIWVLAKDRKRLDRVAIYGAGCIATGLVYFAFNWAITGSPLHAPLQDYLAREWAGSSNSFGFGPHVGPPVNAFGALDMSEGHSPFEGFVNTLTNLAALNIELHGWVIGSLLPILAALVWPRRLTRFDALLGVLLTIVVAVMFTYWFSGAFYVGPRYWYVALPSLLGLSAAGLLAFRDRLSGQAQTAAGPVLWVLCLFAVLIFLPWRGVTKYYSYNKYEAKLVEMLAAGEFGNDLVLVKMINPFGIAIAMRGPDLTTDGPVFARDKGDEENAATIAAYPGRGVTYFPPRDN